MGAALIYIVIITFHVTVSRRSSKNDPGNDTDNPYHPDLKVWVFTGAVIGDIDNLGDLRNPRS